jgi:hypothetical protein
MKKIIIAVSLVLVLASNCFAELKHIGTTSNGEVWAIETTSTKSLGRGWYSAVIGVARKNKVAMGCDVRMCSKSDTFIIDRCVDKDGNILGYQSRSEIIPGSIMESVLDYVVSSYH